MHKTYQRVRLSQHTTQNVPTCVPFIAHHTKHTNVCALHSTPHKTYQCVCPSQHTTPHKTYQCVCPSQHTTQNVPTCMPFTAHHTKRTVCALHSTPHKTYQRCVPFTAYHTKRTNMCDFHGFRDTLIPQSASYCTIQQRECT